MTVIGSFDAKTHLAALLERVQNGERFTITKHGNPVALLAPAKSGSWPNPARWNNHKEPD